MPLKIVALLVLAGVALTPSQSSISGPDLANFDRTVRPQDDLYRAVNGAWLARWRGRRRPPDRVTYGTFLELADKTESDVRAIIEKVAAERDRQRGSARQIADLYASLMDMYREPGPNLRPRAPRFC